MRVKKLHECTALCSSHCGASRAGGWSGTALRAANAMLEIASVFISNEAGKVNIYSTNELHFFLYFYKPQSTFTLYRFEADL